MVSGYFSSWAESHKVPWNMCGSQVLTGMLGRMEHADIGALIAPRPLLIETGDQDLLFPLAAAEASVARLRRVYDHLGAGERLVHDVFDGEHQWHGARRLSLPRPLARHTRRGPAEPRGRTAGPVPPAGQPAAESRPAESGSR